MTTARVTVMIARLLLLCALSLSASLLPPQRLHADDSKQPVRPEDEKSCTARGGRWMGTVQGHGRMTGCLLPTNDAGKPCTVSDECESVCVRGRCHEWSDFRGCGVLVKDGDTVRTLCVD